METNERQTSLRSRHRNAVIPCWVLHLRRQPEVLAAGRALVGRLESETYVPVPYWQLGFFEGTTTVELTRGGRCWQLHLMPGDLFLIPPHSTRRYATVRPIKHDYLVFQFAEAAASDDQVELPAVIPAGIARDSIARDLATVADLRASDRFESDLQAHLVLWRLVRLARLADRVKHGGTDTVQTVLDDIRVHIADYCLTPEALARHAGLSRRRLDQLFFKVTGETVAACIRKRRLQLAVDLLQHSDLPVYIIGEQVGIHDRHAFNKFIRHNCGKSPSAVRREAHRRLSAV